MPGRRSVAQGRCPAASMARQAPPCRCLSSTAKALLPLELLRATCSLVALSVSCPSSVEVPSRAERRAEAVTARRRTFSSDRHIEAHPYREDSP